MAINLKDCLHWSSTAVRSDNLCCSSTVASTDLTNLTIATNTSAYPNTLSICNAICNDHTMDSAIAKWLDDIKDNSCWHADGIKYWPENPHIKVILPKEEVKETEKMPISYKFCVKSVDVYNDKVVKVTFDDGSFTKSVCSDNDHFDVDVGITICLLKKLLGKNPNREYAKLIRDIHKVMDKNEKEKQKAKDEKDRQKKLHRKAELKKAANHLKWKREMIDIQKQAIIEADKYLSEEE